MLTRILATLILFLLTSPAYSWTEVKFNFRSSSAYVTDGAGETRVVSPAEVNTGAAETYTGSVIRDGLTFGWESPAGNVDTRDRNNTPGRERFAGIHFNGTDNQDTFRLNGVTAGCTYEVRLAAGDPSGASTIYFQLFDDVTQFGSTINTTTSTGDVFIDADGGAEMSPANYDANNSPVTRVFASTIFRLKIGNNVSVNTGFISHLHIKQTSCPSGADFYRRRVQ